MRLKAAAFLLMLGGASSVPSLAHATLLIRMEVEDLARTADVVALVRVVDSTADLENGGAIMTRVQLDVERVIAGAAPAGGRFRVSILGGDLPGAIRDYPGARFTPGEHVVVFLKARENFPGEMQVVGAFQGAFRIEEEAETRMPLAVRRATPGNAVLVGVPRDFNPEDGSLALYLDELEARVAVARSAP